MITEKQLQNDISLIGRIRAVPTILEVICRTTKMGFAAVARVTEDRWLACSVRDEINFGLLPGGELKVETTLCNEIRGSGELIVFDNAAEDAKYCNHHTPEIYGLKSYISVPIFLNNGTFFGTLCAIDPRPAKINNPETIGMFRLFAELIAFHFQMQEESDQLQDDLFRTGRQLYGYKEEVNQYTRLINHSLQEPLRKMRLFTDLLVQASQNGSGEKVESAALKVRQFAEDLTGMVRDINEYSAIGVVGSDWQLCDLNEIVSTVANRMQLLIEERQATIESGLLHTIKAAPGQLHRLFYNLIGNAIHYSRPGVPPKIRISSRDYQVQEADPDLLLNPRLRYCEITVEDNGTGLHPVEVQHLFDLFSKKEEKGLTSGLAQVKKIVHRHHGEIVVRSTPGIGSTISIILPIDQ